MFKSPLILPLTLIFAGVLAFMATTGVLPATVLRLADCFCDLGLGGLVSLSSDELMQTESKTAPAKTKTVKRAGKKSAAKAKAR